MLVNSKETSHAVATDVVDWALHHKIINLEQRPTESTRGCRGWCLGKSGLESRWFLLLENNVLLFTGSQQQRPPRHRQNCSHPIIETDESTKRPRLPDARHRMLKEIAQRAGARHLERKPSTWTLQVVVFVESNGMFGCGTVSF